MRVMMMMMVMMHGGTGAIHLRYTGMRLMMMVVVGVVVVMMMVVVVVVMLMTMMVVHACRDWRMGDDFFWNCKKGVLSYVILRPVTTLVGFLTEIFGENKGLQYHIIYYGSVSCPRPDQSVVSASSPRSSVRWGDAGSCHVLG